MGRKSKLTEEQWARIKERLLEGESGRALAEEFGVSETAIRKKVSSQVSEIKSVANQIATAQTALSKLPISSQISAQSLAQRLMSISSHLASAADYGAATAHRLAGIAHMKVAEIDDSAPLTEESVQTLKGVAVLSRMANEASEIGVNLLKANKDKALDEPEKPTMTLDDFYGGSKP
ncbi:helix-turn-helix domain-containing protein [Paraburkholderia antibiotica]|jgi:biotin operon repressor|uniref:Hin recombinase n=1 Tax=Paraburkholderia antibiotica TaxID=2728839 RepID=A0A7Y0A1X3_9BURK|nr:helix-turn-helix domain-containing protein [Paraburkholderia antibiotica]NML34933.1 Hin recombinase [Paraburkholderia antibiotica]